MFSAQGLGKVIVFAGIGKDAWIILLVENRMSTVSGLEAATRALLEHDASTAGSIREVTTPFHDGSCRVR
jgi:hypothetical protein